MLLSSGTTIGRTTGRLLPGLLLRCHFPQIRPSVVPPADHCPGYRSDAALRRYDHRSYPYQTTAWAAAQMLLSSGTTIGRTPGRPLPGLQLCYRFLQVRPSVVPRQTAARAAALLPLSSGTTIGRTPSRPPSRLQLRYRFL